MILLLLSTLMMIGQAQQAPFYTTPQFANLTHRTNVCDRFTKYANGDIEIRAALAGLSVSVGVVDHNNPLYFNLTSEGKIDEDNPGIFAVILDELARRANFTWRDSYARILPPQNTSVPDSTWTDVLVDSVERYDVSFAEWVHSHERRRRGVHFPVGWYDTSTIFIRDTREGIINDFNFESWTRPLDFTLWVLFGLGFIYNRILFWILDKIEDDGSPRAITSKEKAFRIRMVELVFDSNGSNAKRLHNMSASLFAMVFVSSLTANLATFLIQQSEPDFQYVSLEDLDSRFIPVCVRQGDAVFESLSNDFESMNYKLSEKTLGSFQKLLNGDCDVVATRRADFDIAERDPLANPDCTLEWVGRPEYINFGGMATIVDMNDRCTSLVGHVMDLHMHEMTAFVEEAWQGYLRAESSYQCPAKVELEDTRYSLTLNDIGGIFIVYAGLAFLGLFVTMIEQKYERRRVRLAEEAEARGDNNDLFLNENDKKNGKSSHVDMIGHVSGNAGGRVSGTDEIPVDADVLQRILTIDRTLAKLQHQLGGGEKRNSGGGRNGGLFRALSNRSFRRPSDSSHASSTGGGGMVSPRNSGSSPLRGMVSPRNSGSSPLRGSFEDRRPSLRELGKPKSQQNILAMG